MGLFRHHMRAGPGVEPGQDPDDDELEGKRPSFGTLGNSGVERASGLWMGLRPPLFRGYRSRTISAMRIEVRGQGIH